MNKTNTLHTHCHPSHPFPYSYLQLSFHHKSSSYKSPYPNLHTHASTSLARRRSPSMTTTSFVTANHKASDDDGLLGTPVMVSRSLDFRTFGLRLIVGLWWVHYVILWCRLPCLWWTRMSQVTGGCRGTKNVLLRLWIWILIRIRVPVVIVKMAQCRRRKMQMPSMKRKWSRSVIWWRRRCERCTPSQLQVSKNENVRLIEGKNIELEVWDKLKSKIGMVEGGLTMYMEVDTKH